MTASPSPSRRIEIYDTTLRDGAQGEGVTFSLVDKLKIAQHLDALGVDYIEGGYPLSNPKDEAFFAEVAKLKFQHAKVCAFGMTRRRGVKVSEDPGMQALVASRAPVITIVGKTWDLHVDEVLRVDRQENLDMIRESVAFCRSSGTAVSYNTKRVAVGRQVLTRKSVAVRPYKGAEVFYDAEHFFDGYRANPDYALATLLAALEGGATRLILCDTNGGSLPAWVAQVVTELFQKLPAMAPSNLKLPGAQTSNLSLGIHVHNDGGLAIANTLAAVQAGCVQVQGTINGIGERCGNVDLTTVVANLRLKLGYDCLARESLSRLTETSRFVYEIANMNPSPSQPFVGTAAFAHKGGMHVHAVERLARSYEHVEPHLVGNTRRVLVSELSGASNIAATLGKKFAAVADKAVQRSVLLRVQDLENQGYQFEAAVASFELLLHEALRKRPTYWALDHYRCVISKKDAESAVTEAIVKLRVDGQVEHQVAEGDGPVNALDGALRRCLQRHYPQLASVHLRDYKVRVVNATAESAAKVRVVIDFAVRQGGLARGNMDAATVEHFSTVGVSENIVDASWQALTDAFAYHLIESRAKPAGG